VVRIRRKRGLRLTLQQRRDLAGVSFTLPLIVGFVLFFLYPFAQSLLYSFSKLTISREGIALENVGWANYREALLVHPEYVRVLTETIVKMVVDVPLILALSFFAALLLNQKFRGRLPVRVIFFLPVIYGAGVILKMESTDYMMLLQSTHAGARGEMISVGASLRSFLMQAKLPEALLLYIMQGIARVPELVRSCGVQTLVFLAGLQSVPPALFEAADVEGSTAWESFWMITLPMMSPLILTNVVYTVVDFFTSGRSALLGLVQKTAFSSGSSYGLSVAMSWIYFAAIGVILATTIGVISRKVFYHE
jgi:ABC-type sugar transport system permease subunit